MDGGDICITASDDGLNASNPESDSSSMDPMASDETCSITINGGELYVVAQGDGIDSNGDIIVTGGNIRISTMANGADSAIDYSGEAYITGGTVVACGGSAMAQNFGENSTQGSILQCLNETVEGQVVLYDAGGNELLSYTPENAYNCVVVSAPEILIGENYQLEIAGESYDIAMESVIYGMSQGMGFGALQKFNGKMSENLDGERPEMPEGFDGKMPEDFDGERPEMPEGFDGKMPEDFDGERPEMPEGFDGKMPVDN